MNPTPVETEAFVMFGPGRGAVGAWRLRTDEVTIEVEACGICQRETGTWLGRLPRLFPDVLGHEVVGRVVAGPLPTGTRVAGMGIEALARHVRVPAWQVAPVPAEGPELTMVEPLACSINAVEQDPSPKDGLAVVVGLGLLGLFVAALEARNHRDVTAFDPDPSRRRLARRLGIRTVLDPDRLADLLPRAAVCYEASGQADPLWQASANLPPGSGLVLVGHQQQGDRSAHELLDIWHTRGIAVRNAVPRTSEDMGACVAAAAKLPIDLGLLPVRRKSLRRTADLLDSWPRGDIVRHIVTMD